jgi:hypothetical protein
MFVCLLVYLFVEHIFTDKKTTTNNVSNRCNINETYTFSSHRVW